MSQAPAGLADDLADRAASLETLDDLRAAGTVPAEVLREAAWYVSRPPPAATWRRILDPLALILGIALIVAGTLYLVAFNWGELGRFSKIAVGVLPLVAAGVVPWFLPPNRLARKLVLTSGIPLTLGALLTVGLAYPTTSAGWPLLVVWALLSVPWAAAARFAPAWLVAVVAADVAAVAALYWRETPGLSGLTDAADQVLLAVIAIHLVAWAGFALAPRLGIGGATEWVRQTLLAPILLLMAWWPIETLSIDVWGDTDGVNVTAVLGMLAFILVSIVIQVGFYLKQIGPFPAAAQTLAILAVSTALVGRGAIEVIDELEGLGLFMTIPMGVFVLAELAIAAAWLVHGWRRQHQAAP